MNNSIEQIYFYFLQYRGLYNNDWIGIYKKTRGL